MKLRPGSLYPDTRIPSQIIISTVGGEVKTFVEVGVLQGDQAAEVFFYLNPEESWLVDPWSTDFAAGYAGTKQKEWDEMHDFVQRRFQSFPGVNILRNTSEEAASLVPDDLDFVYIDGDHSYLGCKLDIESWWPKIKVGGILGGDDLEYSGVQSAIGEFIRGLKEINPNYKLNIVESYGGGQWWFVKQPARPRFGE